MQMEYIGAYLRFKREQQHKDAGALCLSCNLTRMQLHSIEQGKSEAHPNTIKRICDYLNIDFIALFQHQEKYRELLEESFNRCLCKRSKPYILNIPSYIRNIY